MNTNSFPMADIHVLKAEQEELVSDIMRPISMEEMMNLNVFFARYGVTYPDSSKKEGE